MIKTDEIDLWNLSRGGIARSGAVDIFNVVGHVRDPDTLDAFNYRLNDGAETPIFFLRPGAKGGRLGRPGDFNIDTIGSADLAADNLLSLRTLRNGGRQQTLEIPFRARPFAQPEPSFRLDLNGVTAPEEVGQIVEGPWRVGRDASGRRCLEVAPEDAGYDRIILFGRGDWTTGYEVRARLAVTRITGAHNIGLVFKWNPHARGDGTWLPRVWSSGLGYYCSYAERPGIRIRYGVQVRRDESGRKQGDFLLAESPLHTRCSMLLTRLKQRTRLWRGASDLALNRDYGFRMRVHPERYQLTVWPADRREPAPQVVVARPVDPLPHGSVGILALRVGVRLYEYEVTPLSGSPA